MHFKIQHLLITGIMLFVCVQKSYSQKNLVTRQVDKNTVARRLTGKENVIPYLQQRSKNGVVNVYEFNAAALEDSVFNLNVFPGETVKIWKQKVFKRTGDNFSWHGYIMGPDGQQGSIAMVYLNGELSGNLNYKAGNYSITPMGKGAFSLYEIDFKRAPKVEDAPGMTDTHENANSANSENAVALAATACNLRVLVAITPSAETYIKNSLGFSSLTQFSLQAIAETNQAYLNSGVNIQMELAASVRVSYTESGNYSTDLTRFMNTADGYMDEIHTYRNLYAADVNVMIFNNNSACGLASTILANAASAFGVVHYDCALGYYSFGHEIGHLQGCRHNPEQDPSTTPYSYGHGYLYTAGGWRTIMAYNYSGETRLQYFSNPNVTYGGVPMGTTSTHYNAQVLNVTSNTINGFRTAASTLTIDGTGAVINDESSDAIATSEVILQNGFEATTNAEFSARIIDCTGSSLMSENNSEESSNADQLADNKLILAVYPTITEGTVNISMDNTIDKQVEIVVTDNTGRMVFRLVNAGKKIVTLNLGHLTNGLYFVQVKQGEKMITRKVIISH